MSIAVPLSSRHPIDLINYYIQDSEAQIVVTMPEYEAKLKPSVENMGRKLIVVDQSCIVNENESNGQNCDTNKDYNVFDINQQFSTGQFYRESNAMILYTSGSTGRPKGTVISHKNITSQASTLADVWKINQNDSVLHILPLNHVHGCCVNLLCPLSVGAKVTMHSKFDPSNVWSTLLNINAPSKDRISVFMAVPTIYSLLIAEYEKAFSSNERMIEYVRAQCEKKIRLMVSGSAPLPVSTYV